jgi:hypothetical protein
MPFMVSWDESKKKIRGWIPPSTPEALINGDISTRCEVIPR